MLNRGEQKIEMKVDRHRFMRSQKESVKNEMEIVPSQITRGVDEVTNCPTVHISKLAHGIRTFTHKISRK